MKECTKCGAKNDSIASACASCFHPFNDVAASPASTPAQKGARPDGNAPLDIGLYCAFLGVVGIFVAMMMADSYESRSFFTSFNISVIGGVLFSLGLVLWSVGYIVKAISFLPAKGE